MEVRALSQEELAKMDDKSIVELSVKYAKELGMDEFTIQEIKEAGEAGSARRLEAFLEKPLLWKNREADMDYLLSYF